MHSKLKISFRVPRVKGLWVVICLVVVLGCFIRLAYRNVVSQSIWFDEAVLFWKAQGQLETSAPLTPRGNLVDVIKANAREDLSPGGFTVLLHYWTGASTSISWMRVLSFIFFVISCALLGAISARWSQSLPLGILCALLPFLDIKPLHYAFEIRAYMMEYCGVMAVFWAWVRLREKPVPSRFLLLGTCCGFFLFSRYSFVAYAFAATGMGALLAWQSSASNRPKQFALLCGPVLLAGIAILLMAFLPQSLDNTPVGFIGPALRSETPWFYVRHLLQGKTFEQEIGILGRNFWSLEGGGMTAFAALSLVILLSRRGKHIETTQGVGLMYYFLVSHIILIGFSYAGLSPLDVTARWSLHIHAISALGWSAVLSSVYLFCKNVRKRSTRISALGVWGLGAAILFGLSIRNASFRRIDQDALYQTFQQIGTAKLNASQLYICTLAKAVSRYYLEMGKVNLSNYPHNVVFEAPSDWKENPVIDIEGQKLNYLVLYPSVAQSLGRIPTLFHPRLSRVELNSVGPEPYVYEVR